MSDAPIVLAVRMAETRVAAMDDATTGYCDALVAEAAAIVARDEFVSAEIARLIGQPNAQTGKEHSVTSAERFVKGTSEFKALEQARQMAECARIVAATSLERSKLSARIAVAALDATVEASA